MGLIGGMSWESTATYYRLMNEGVRARLGGHHSAEMILYSVDFAVYEQMQREGRWEEAGSLLGDSARALEHAGARFIVLCTNTMHKVAPAIERSVSIPLLHIADPTAEAVRAAGIRRIGLLGTRFTMEQEFYVGRLRDRFGLEVVVPAPQDRELVHRVIYEELVRGIVREESRAQYRKVVDRLVESGAKGIILGCTEIAMVIDPKELRVPCFDTTALHAAAAVEMALAPST